MGEGLAAPRPPALASLSLSAFPTPAIARRHAPGARPAPASPAPPPPAPAVSAYTGTLLPLPRSAPRARAEGPPSSSLASSAVCFRVAEGLAAAAAPPPPLEEASSLSSSSLWPAPALGQGDRRGAGVLHRAALLWFRADLRLHDHDALARALAESATLAPVYVFDPRDYGRSASGFDRTGPYRARFVLEAVGELRAALRRRGSELLVRVGRPEEVLPELAATSGASAVYCHGEVSGVGWGTIADRKGGQRLGAGGPARRGAGRAGGPPCLA